MEMFNNKNLGSIGKKLLRKKETIAIAESVTSGLLQFAFSTIKDASCFYQGGITAFNIGQKFKHLQVDPVHALAVNSVSQKVAEEMAQQVCSLFKSDWGIGVTGYATPEPPSGHKLFAFYAIAFKNKIRAKGKLSLSKGEPTEVQLYYTNKIVNRLLELV
ncbi:MAG TPA: CinA family protein [Chitinophagaceae bacterium]|nr:CinA family protein [Chitinophagaceae bacterium]